MQHMGPPTKSSVEDDAQSMTPRVTNSVKEVVNGICERTLPETPHEATAPNKLSWKSERTLHETPREAIAPTKLNLLYERSPRRFRMRQQSNPNLVL